MRNLNFHFVKAQNILCFGEQGIEINFQNFGNIIQVRGINLDMPGTQEHPASNASGKSSIQELLSIGLYGRTVKSPTKNKGDEILNVLAEKGTLEVQWDDFRVVRTFSKSSAGSIKSTLKFWKSEDKIWDKNTEIDRPARIMQIEIEKVIGLSHHSFCNVVIFDDSREYCFLEADTPKKREIIENLLDLDQYREYHQNAKELFKTTKTNHEFLLKEYSRFIDEFEAACRRVSNSIEQETSWKIQKKRTLENLQNSIVAKQKKLENTDSGEQLANWQKAQDKIAQLSLEISGQEDKLKRIQEVIKSARLKIDSARSERSSIQEDLHEKSLQIKSIQSEIDRISNLMNKLKNLKDGAECPYCMGVINRCNHEHVIEKSNREIEKLTKNQIKDNLSIAEEKEKLSAKTASIGSMEEKLREADGKVALLESSIRKMRLEMNQLSAISKPEGTSAEQVLESEITELKKQIKTQSEEMENSPYKEIIEQSKKEKDKKESERDLKSLELQDSEAEIPYYQFWAEAFGDNGIRKFVIDGIIPALNERVAFWMDVLCEGFIELTFDNKLEVTILRNGNPAKYSNMSNGEKQRINLAVSQAFAYVMMLNSGTCPSIVFLDEVTGGGIDRAGTSGVYNMIFELAKERKVFVTTHNENLIGLLQGCETLTLKKQNDITVLNC